MKKDVAVRDQFTVMEPNQNIMEIIQMNMGGEALSISDMVTIKMPLGGAIVWTLPSSGEDEVVKTFEGIIVHSQIQRTYWKEPFSGKGKGGPPDCFSNDATYGTGTPGGKCGDCPNDKFGTAHNGKGKACATKRIMFILQQDSLLPSVIRAPVGSLKNSREYLGKLASERQAMFTVVTEFGLEKVSNKDGIEYSAITMKKTKSLTDEEVEIIKKYREDIMPYINQTAETFVADES